MRAVILGGTGAIGAAVALRLLHAGWRVDVTGRDEGKLPGPLLELGARFTAIDAADHAGVRRLVGSGANLLLSTTAFTAAAVRGLEPSLRNVDSAVLISGRAVYADAQGHHANSVAAPRFDGPVSETQATLAPAAEDAGTDPFSAQGYGPHKRAMEMAALDSGLPITVLRPGKVHGPWARNARTAAVVDALRRHQGTVRLLKPEDVCQLSAAANIAALVAFAASAPAARILNAADQEHPTAGHIVARIAQIMEWKGELLTDAPPEARADAARPEHPAQLEHPWRAPTPFVLDMTAARRLGYRPAGTALDLLEEEVRWVLSRRTSAPR